jgi:hypothetical protein
VANIREKITSIFSGEKRTTSEYAYPLSPNIMMFLAKYWEQLKADEDAINVLMDKFDLAPEVAKQHLEMAKEEFGEIGKPLTPVMVEKYSQLNEGFEVTDEMVDKVIAELKLDASDTYKKELKMGIKVEQEHGPDRGEDTNITDDDLIMTAKIAVSHLKELPDYYTRLDQMEKEGKQAKKK